CSNNMPSDNIPDPHLSPQVHSTLSLPILARQGRGWKIQPPDLPMTSAISSENRRPIRVPTGLALFIGGTMLENCSDALDVLVKAAVRVALPDPGPVYLHLPEACSLDVDAHLVR